MTAMSRWLAAGLVATAAACGGTARGLEAYRNDTGALLETRTAQLSAATATRSRPTPG
jgi:hypothetical protein